MLEKLIVGLCAVFVVVLLVVMCWGVGSLIVYLGWNLALSPIFGLPEVTVTQAVLLFFLVVLVGGVFRVGVGRK